MGEIASEVCMPDKSTPNVEASELKAFLPVAEFSISGASLMSDVYVLGIQIINRDDSTKTMGSTMANVFLCCNISLNRSLRSMISDWFCSIFFIHSVCLCYLVTFAIVAIIAAMLAMPVPRLMVSAMFILRVILLGTTISQPG